MSLKLDIASPTAGSPFLLSQSGYCRAWAGVQFEPELGLSLPAQEMMARARASEYRDLRVPLDLCAFCIKYGVRESRILDLVSGGVELLWT